MKSGKWLLITAIAGICGVLMLAGCSSTAKRRFLTTFFDGVPPEHPGTNAVPVASAATDADRPAAAKPAPVVQPVSTYYAHPPFINQQCSACHESGIGQGMKQKTPDLCFNCHKDFLTGMKVKHQPVESGDCKSCHDPHQSETSSELLLKTGKALCFDCHDNFLEKAKTKHQPAESGECLACHDPHANGNKHLITKTGAALCWDCHDNFLEKAKVKHQPAENGECTSCHNPHANDNKKLVSKTGPALCWDCHDNFIEKARFKHDVVGDCTSCHNPHQSGERALLLKTAAKLCLDCHEEKDLKADKGHANADNISCVQCHDPHVGDNKNLLKPVKNLTRAN